MLVKRSYVRPDCNLPLLKGFFNYPVHSLASESLAVTGTTGVSAGIATLDISIDVSAGPGWAGSIRTVLISRGPSGQNG